MNGQDGATWCHLSRPINPQDRRCLSKEDPVHDLGHWILIQLLWMRTLDFIRTTI
jgi:hypothetical protein